MMVKSIEPQIKDLVCNWLRSYGVDYKLEQEELNSEIDNALKKYQSKSGGKGGNRPDLKLLLKGKSGVYYPVLMECKGHNDKLVKIDKNGVVENRTAKNETAYNTIKNYAVNGAVHYANALLEHTHYTRIFAIGITGYKDGAGKIIPEISAYYVSDSNLGMGQEIGGYSDLSFLAPGHFHSFIDKVNKSQLSEEELDRLKALRESEIDISLRKLNHDIYQNEKGLGENDRVYLVAASIIATIGAEKTLPLETSDLKSSQESGNTDGDIMVRKISAFLTEKNIPPPKRNLILRTLENTLTTENINKVTNGETQLKRVFTKIIDELGIYYKIGLTTDFTGKLFNEMYGWLGFTQDKLNDVVLTPSYIATLMVKLARVNRNSYVWDFAAGSAGLLVAAMNEMLDDAKANINSPEELLQKQLKIKAEQLLGLELLSSVYMLAILNMILMGDGSSNILNRDSIKDFDGKYGFGETDNAFPADAFVLNPPYSADGNGMNFVECALDKMQKGYAAIIIQNSAGSGRAKEYNKRILKNHTLLASIKMPPDIFIGKSSVQTNIYVFRVKEAHKKDERVKFIDFSNDGYTRTNRKKASNNLKDTDRAKQRYAELVDLVRFGESKLNIFTRDDYYESTIDPENGADWNQSAPIDTTPTLDDFKKTVGDYLSWEVSQILTRQAAEEDAPKVTTPLSEMLAQTEWGEFKLGDLFEIAANPQLNKSSFSFNDNGEHPYFTRTVFNNGILGYVDYLNDTHKISGNCLAVGMIGMQFFYMKKDFYAGQFTKRAIPKSFFLTQKIANYFISLLNKHQKLFQNVLVRNFENTFNHTKIKLPVRDGKIDFDFMERFIAELERDHIAELDAYLKAAGLKD